MSNTIIYAVLGALGVLVLAMVIMLSTLKKRVSKEDEEIRTAKKQVSSSNFLYFVYRFFNIPILRNYKNKIETRVTLIYPSDQASIKRKTSEFLTKTMLASLLGILVVLITARGNLLFICSGLLVVGVFVAEVINNSFHSIERKILEQLKNAIERINHYYASSPFPDYALSRTVNDLQKEDGYEISLHLKNIYEIIIAPNTQEALDQYSSKSPNKYIMQLAMIFTSIKTFGDKKLENGKSLFIDSLQNLKSQVQSEILDLERNKNAFAGTTWICLVVILLMKPFESWVNKNIPEAATYYKGTYGVIAMVGLFLISITCYELVVNLRDGSTKDTIKEKSVWRTLAEFPLLRNPLNMIIASKYTKYEKLENDLKKMGDRTGVKSFIVQRFVFAIASFILVMAMFIMGVAQSKAKQFKEFTGAFENSVSSSEEYQEIMEQTAVDYAQIVQNNKDITKEELTAQIMASNNIRKEKEAELIAETLLKRKAVSAGIYFQWYYLILAILGGYLGYMIPMFFIKKKQELTEERMEEELVGFQSLILILMNMNGTTLESLLSWMERFSYCFKTAIIECRRDLSKGPQYALENFKLKEKDEYPPLALFVDNLLEIDKSGVVNAFSEIEADKDYLLKQREEKKKVQRDRRSRTARNISMIPLYAIIILQLIVPIGLMAMNMFKDFSQYM